MTTFRSRRRHKSAAKGFFTFLFLVVLIVVSAIGWWFYEIAPVNANDQKERTFTVAQGEGIKQIANNLKTQKLIKDPNVFYFLVLQQKADNKIQAGKFRLSPAMSTQDIIIALQQATNDIRITIPEGKRAEEVAEILQQNFPNYQSSWKDQLVANEGYLFPDTYSFHNDADIMTIIKIMRANFEKKYASIPDGKKDAYSQEDIVIIASMIEREARFAEDRPLVASVIFNRLDTSMPLQIDATVQYALGYQTATNSWWKKDLTFEDLKIGSAYNTYENPGLPPGPISNPGLEVLQAVIDAPETEYLYYVSDSSGHNHYTKTLEEHDANIKKFGL